jgi:hypothetical protein
MQWWRSGAGLGQPARAALRAASIRSTALAVVLLGPASLVRPAASRCWSGLGRAVLERRLGRVVLKQPRWVVPLQPRQAGGRAGPLQPRRAGGRCCTAVVCGSEGMRNVLRSPEGQKGHFLVSVMP